MAVLVAAALASCIAPYWTVHLVSVEPRTDGVSAERIAQEEALWATDSTIMQTDDGDHLVIEAYTETVINVRQ